MSTLTPGQVYTLARDAGFDPATATLMTAIAAGESGLRTDAEGDKGLTDSTWGPSIGLWQIRSIKAQTGTGGPRDASRLKDPAFNAASARSIYKGQGLGAWSVYTSGAYRSHLGAATAGSSSPGPRLPANAVPAAGAVALQAGGGVLGGLDAVGSFFGALGQRATWVRVLQVVGGAVLIVGGVAIIGKGLIAEVATSIIPGGEAVKAVAKAVT